MKNRKLVVTVQTLEPPPRLSGPQAPPTQRLDHRDSGSRPPLERPLPAPRRYPTPPALTRRLALLILRPEQWAEAARYPFHITLAPLLLVILLAAALTGLSAGLKTLPTARAFAAVYDQRFPTLVYENGRLHAEPSKDKELPRFVLNEVPIVVDPTETTTLDTLSSERAIVVGPDQIAIRPAPNVSYKLPLKQLFEIPAIASLTRINSAGLLGWLNREGSTLSLWVGVAVAFSTAAANLLWAVVVAFLIMPLVLLGAPHLRMPRRIAYRIAAAVTIPLIALDAVMRAFDVAPARLIGAANTPILWFAAAAALAFWAGIIAGRLFTLRRLPRRDV